MSRMNFPPVPVTWSNTCSFSVEVGYVTNVYVAPVEDKMDDVVNSVIKKFD